MLCFFSVRRISCCWLLSLTLMSATKAARADEHSAADLLPASTVLLAELHQPPRLLTTILQHPIRQRVEALDEVQQAYHEKGFLELKTVVAKLETHLGSPWDEILAQVADRGVTVAIDAETQGAVLLVESSDPSIRNRLLDVLTLWARQDASSKGRPDPIKTGEYRGIPVRQAGEARLASFGPWLLVTNKPELGKAILDRSLDSPGESLATVESYQAAREQCPSDATAWAYIDLATLREAGVARKFFEGQAENPVVELLIGGIQSNLRQTPYVSATLSVTTDHLSLRLAAPHDAGWVEESREYFFGPDGDGFAPAPLDVDNLVFSLNAYRNVSEMWLRAGDLFNERINDGIAQADSSLTTLFSGKDFGEEILGAVQPDIQLVAARQEFAAEQPTPAIQLPAFGIALTLKDPLRMRSELRRTFQSLVGFLNVVGAMNGQPQLDLDMEQEGDVQLVSATYLPEPESDPERMPINFNFSPSVAFEADRFIIASTKEMARALAQSEPSATDEPPGNTAASLDLQVVREILADNRDQLVAQNMLEEGNSKDEAERQIDLLLMLVGFFQDASVELAQRDGQLCLQLDLRLN